MELRPRSHEAIVELIRRGVQIPNPLTLDIGPEVDLERISTRGVVLFPGCRIYGAATVISAGVKLGAEGPVTIDDCRLGPHVELKGGYFHRSVFLAKASMGLGAHVREGSILEEEANGAHCVGLKQTILFPFVTLGSLINFCDCLMAGGTSRKDHSEVGSSYIHFNFTPDGNKTTASLFGDVPRGVMLNRRPIFLGGQGGSVGPVRVGYGTVTAAGSILRDDIGEDDRFVIVAPHPGVERSVALRAHKNLRRVVTNNLTYLANLVALEEWYRQVRRPFFAAQELGQAVYEGALEMLMLAKEERTKRLRAMVEGVYPSDTARAGLKECVAEICALFFQEPSSAGRDEFLASFREAVGGRANSIQAEYVSTIQKLPAAVTAQGEAWLQGIVDDLCRQAAAFVPGMGLFEDEIRS